MATHNWNANYHELLSLLEIPTLETRRLELNLGHLFKIVHNLCFFPQEIIKFREQTSFLSNTRFVHSLHFYQPRAHTKSYHYRRHSNLGAAKTNYVQLTQRR